MRTNYAFSRQLIGRSLFRTSEHFLADGRRDPSRSRYWVNGRVVRHGTFQRLLRAVTGRGRWSDNLTSIVYDGVDITKNLVERIR